MKIDKDTSKYKDEPIYKMGMLRVLKELLEITFCNEDITKEILIEFDKKVMDKIQS